jgi:hypothetical protein
MAFVRNRACAVALIAAAAVGLLASWRLELEPGTIGLFHDWSIFPSASQNVAYAQQLFDGWYRWTLGEPVVLPTEYPLRFLVAVAGTAGVGGGAVSHLLVFLIPAAAFFCAWLLAEQLTGSQVGALAAGLFYALNPVMLNKIVSGQVSYIVGYSVLPASLWAYERALMRKSLWSAAGFGLLASVAAVQLQLGVVAVLLALLWGLIPSRGSGVATRLGLWIVGCAVAVVVHLPTVVGLVGGAPGFENVAQLSNSAAYLELNSVAIPDAVRLIGYVTRYAEFSFAHWWLLWNAAMVVVLGYVAVGIGASPPRFRIFSLVALSLTFAFVAGTHSPFGFVIVWLFNHVRYMRGVGELYHLMVVPALVYACAMAFAVQYLKKLRRKVPSYAVAALSLACVCGPMMTGDASGWLHAFPLEAAYGDVLRGQIRGSTRVLWLPMEQPLAFKGKGAGVDPMAVTARGSLWDYTLNWPLTAVDADIHDGGDLTSALRALNVGVVVDRKGMTSELWRYTADGKDTRRFLLRRAPIGLTQTHHYRESTAYAVPSPLPLMWRPSEIAVVPQRLSVCAAAMLAGYAPIAFAQARPSDLPYAVFYDPTDVPEEVVEHAGAEQSLPTVNVYAPWGFAPVSAWWWLRKAYADAPNIKLTIDPHVATIFSHPALRNAVAVVGWLATPDGGRMQISAAGHAVVIDTLGSGEWRSQAVPLGRLSVGAPVGVASLDRSAEVAVRGFTLIEASKYARMVGEWRQFMRGADARIAISQTRKEVVERSGRTSAVGYLAGTNHYRLIARSAPEDFFVKSADGFPLARVSRTSPVFEGGDAKAHIQPFKTPFKWRLVRVSMQPLHFPKARNDGASRLIAWSWERGDWQTSVPTRQFVSALGTTLFETLKGGEDVEIYYGKAAEFHVAYIAGLLVLIAGVLIGIYRAIRRPAREAGSRVRPAYDDTVAKT